MTEGRTMQEDSIPYETDEGVVVAVDLDGTVHRMKPIPPASAGEGI